MYETKFAIRQLQLSSTSWTDVQGVAILPIACNTVVILNTSGQTIYLRSDPGNALSQIPVGNGQQFTVGGFPISADGTRFSLGGPAACSLLATSGTPTIYVESIR